MKGGEKWDMATGKEAAMVEKQGEAATEETAETKKEHEVELELNDILKRSPSGFAVEPRSWPVGGEGMNTHTCHSHHILQIILPLFEKSESDTTGQVHHRPRPLRG